MIDSNDIMLVPLYVRVGHATGKIAKLLKIYSGTPLERPLDTVNLNINILISTPDKRPPRFKGNISGAKGVVSQQRFFYTFSMYTFSFERLVVGLRLNSS